MRRSGLLPAATAVDGEPIRRGRIYVAAADRHLLVIDGRLRLSRGPTENGHRPAIDPLFRSAARSYGPRVIGVVLSGSRDDGAAGLAVIRDAGGLVVVQDPSDAQHPSMPRAAMDQVTADHVAPAGKLGRLLDDLIRTEVHDPVRGEAPLLDAEVGMAAAAALSTDDLGVPPAGYGCPDCGGALFEPHSTAIPRFRCRVGHAWSPDSLLEEHAASLEKALWMALRTLEEKKSLSERLAASHAERGNTTTTRRYEVQAEEAGRAAGLIRDLIDRIGATPQSEEETHPAL
jgi:two-component system chemotaxis response regulator CheB